MNARFPEVKGWPMMWQAAEGNPGTGKTDAIVALVDLMSTFSTLTGQPVPAGLAPDSRDFSPVLLGQQKTARDEIVVHGGRGDLALRVGDWKLIPRDSSQLHRRGYRNAKEVPAGPVLYNLAEDPAEKHNLAASHPDIVTRLSARLEAICNPSPDSQ